MMTSGVAFGTQLAWLLCNNTGWPSTKTRVAPVIHCPVTQGLGAPDTLNGQPTTAYGLVKVVTG
jgi:hypothetical protein